MPEGQTFTTRIVVSGAVDPSLAKSLGISQTAMLKLNELTAKLGASNKVVAKSYMTFAPELQKAQVQADRLNSSMRRVGEIVAGIGIADTIGAGLKEAVGLAKQLGQEFYKFASEGSKLAAQRELMVRGLGNILGNQAASSAIYEQMFGIAKSSPYQAKDLIDPVKRFVASGMSLQNAQWLAVRQGDLMAGIGGGQDEMSRATLAFQEISAKGYANSKQLNTQLGALGIPVQKTLEKILNVTPEQLDKMIKKHQITENVVMKMVDVLTGPGGMFFKSMEKFATTFQGLETTIIDEWQRFQADFGDIANAWTKLFYGFVGGPQIWDRVNQYMKNLGGVNNAILAFAHTIPAGEIFGPLQKYFKGITDTFHWINGPTGLGYFFDYDKGGTQGSFYETGDASKIHLNMAGQDKLKEIMEGAGKMVQGVGDVAQKIISISNGVSGAITRIQPIISFLNAVDDLIYGHNPQTLINMFGTKNVPTSHSWDVPANARSTMYQSQFGGPHFASGGIVTSPTIGLIGEAGPEAILPLSSDNTLDDLTDAICSLNSFLTNVFPDGTPGGGVGAGYGGIRGGVRGGGSGSLSTIYGPGVWGDQPGQANYDWDSYHGIGHIHGKAYPLSAGSVAMHADYAEGVLHLKPGDWFTNPRNGKRQRWMDTSGARNSQNIDEFVPAGGNTYNINIHAIDSKSFEDRIKDHARTIRKHIESESNHQAKLNSKALV